MNRRCAMNPFAAVRRTVLVARCAACALAVLGASAALAQTARPKPASAPTAQALPALGTLILTPAQRRSLEALRNAVANTDSSPAPLPSAQTLDAVSSLPDTLVISGVVMRSGNRSTVWVNGEALYGRIGADPLRALARQAGVLQSGTPDLQLKARPGQVIDVPSGQAVDLLPPGAVRIIPPKAGAADVNRAMKKESSK